jgi:ribosomal protein S18 acetylase RimI-like enzyme
VELLETWGREPVSCEYESVGNVDFEEIDRIAIETGGHSRLYQDPEIPRDLADAHRLMTVVNADKIIAQKGGFLAWWEEPRVARIEIIAVDPQMQGRGIGSNLLRVWMTMMVGKEMVLAGTQSTNPAREFYRNHGFKIVLRERTFHK